MSGSQLCGGCAIVFKNNNIVGQPAYARADVGKGAISGGPYNLARWKTHHSFGRGMYPTAIFFSVFGSSCR